MILKNNLFFIFWAEQVLVYREFKWQIIGQEVLNFQVLILAGFCCNAASIVNNENSDTIFTGKSPYEKHCMCESEE